MPADPLRVALGVLPSRPVAAVSALVLVAGGGAVLGLAQPAPPVHACHVAYTVTARWVGGYTASVRVTNTGSVLNGWTLKFTLPGDEVVSQHWNANFGQSGREVTATDGSYNVQLRTNQSTDIGFNGRYSVHGSFPGDPSPSSFSLDGTPCTGVVSSTAAPPAPALPSTPAAPPTAPALTADGHLFESSQRWAQYRVGGYAISNDEWGTGYNTQTLWVNSAENWGLRATQPDTLGVKSYANIGVDPNVALDSLSSVTSSFSESNPADGNWESAYDLWLNGTGIEVMAWTYVSGDARPLGEPDSTVTLGGSTWTLYVGDNGHNPTYSFVRSDNESSGTVDLLSLLKYLEKTRGYFANPVLSSIQYGWEITGTGDVEKDFTMNAYSATTSTH